MTGQRVLQVLTGLNKIILTGTGKESTWRVILSFEQKTNTSDKKLKLIKNYWEKVESELRSVCTTDLRLLDKYIIANAANPESCLLSENGDYFPIDDQKQTIDNSQGASQKALDINMKEMQPTRPIHLGLALSFSILYSEILNNPELAYTLAKTTFDEAIIELDALNEDSYKNILIMQ
ncbi:hypothetical protein E2I00_001615 [Balaenoptera physalus]|uniref:14-3-3 domain-containing protein n=1 Tax=Balaenoptera physalus TaxID=9770 RepID=A0A643ATK4_BALPH|nr:hypothetical protein E2I00_001615 [Balaenoptera physalus]